MDPHIYYEKCRNMSPQDLAVARLGNSMAAQADASVAQLVYEEKMMEEQYKFNKEQIELQHELNRQNIELQNQKNTELVEKQVRWVKFSAFITAGATLLAAILGWYLGKENQKTKDLLQQQIESKPSSGQQTKTFPCVPLKPYSAPQK